MGKQCRLCADQSGNVAAEYALLALLVGVAIVGALEALSGGISTLYERIGSVFP